MLGWLLWWRIDEDEFIKQVAQYDSLRIAQSAKGRSFLLLIFSAAATTAFIVFSDYKSTGFIDVFIALILGYLTYRGWQWAVIGSMIWWSLEKAYLIYEATVNSRADMLMTHLIWWSLYMHFFYLAFRVERSRKNDKGSEGSGT